MIDHVPYVVLLHTVAVAAIVRLLQRHGLLGSNHLTAAVGLLDVAPQALLRGLQHC